MSEAFQSKPMTVEDAWIDYNGHMNMAYYSLLFDRGADGALDRLGIGAAYAREKGFTIYTAEIHIAYLRELHRGDEVTVSLQLLEYDAKRLRTFQEVRHADGWVAATAETLMLHIDMSGPKVAAFQEETLALLEVMKAEHAGLLVPERAGRGIALKRPS